MGDFAFFYEATWDTSSWMATATLYFLEINYLYSLYELHTLFPDVLFPSQTQNTQNRKKRNKTKILQFDGWMDTTLKPLVTYRV